MPNSHGVFWIGWYDDVSLWGILYCVLLWDTTDNRWTIEVETLDGNTGVSTTGATRITLGTISLAFDVKVLNQENLWQKTSFCK